MSTEPILVIVSGAPASGKTTLGRRLAAEFQLPFVGKDDIKEILFEQLGWSDRAWSIKLGIATYHLMYQAIEVQLRAHRSLIVESNFKGEHATAKFLSLKSQYDCSTFQVLCRADPQVMLERYQRRWESGERHPGHLDHIVYEELAVTQTEDDYRLLLIGGASVVVDTTDFATANFQLVSQSLRAFIDGQGYGSTS